MKSLIQERGLNSLNPFCQSTLRRMSRWRSNPTRVHEGGVWPSLPYPYICLSYHYLATQHQSLLLVTPCRTFRSNYLMRSNFLAWSDCPSNFQWERCYCFNIYEFNLIPKNLSACRTHILPPSISHCLLLSPVVLLDLTTSREATFWHDLIVLPISNGSALIALTFMNSNEKYP